MRYTIARLNREFPNEDACLKFLFEAKKLQACPRCGTEPRFYKLSGRKCYSCMHCALHIYPTAGTIFHKSETPLKSWFFAIFLFGNSKNGVSAKELERHLGVTYKTCYRMKKLIQSVYEMLAVQNQSNEREQEPILFKEVLLATSKSQPERQPKLSPRGVRNARLQSVEAYER